MVPPVILIARLKHGAKLNLPVKNSIEPAYFNYPYKKL